MVVFLTLFGADRLNRTNVGTCATVSTKLRVNHIDISFTDSFNWAFVDTSPTGSTLI